MSATLNSERIGANLKHLIKEKYGTQEKFAKACDMSIRQVRRWTNTGVDNINAVANLAKVLDVELSALLA